ncbi:hypothetical protein [Lundtoftevirus Lu221]|uniref:Uncharacterized protein n=1 Tax=phage PKM.Lu.22.1 TaxID=3049197 RepID=A0AAF0KYS8_9CAUD|nr:hypothetical protein [phage PKM.Lu.22.1]
MMDSDFEIAGMTFRLDEDAGVIECSDPFRFNDNDED